MDGQQKTTTENHAVARIGWLRAAVLGANDGIVSTASLMVGVSAAASAKPEVLVAGVAGLVAGAMSMAAGEYVSVSSQADTEAADLARERGELATRPEQEREELATIYRERGLSDALALEVADALMAKDALAAHSRDELGLSETTRARPLQAAFTSALTFAAGAALPLLAAWLLPLTEIPLYVSLAALVFLMFLGAVGAAAGGAPVGRAVLRVAFWGALAMAATYGIGRLFGTSVA
ncbi:VIT1/CCC1 family predicted Fe2+/Mn2+ transporter [Novosphingobium kunmingense]|uniref:VIT1/CCC1 family predicted Fe2+/Mn2+ transporter n=1 Tax=Novosphingobium kunmingense TaxID=1211806 RepID=A0A2N0H753_9SPHN|nr:VIT family protein [Novosphingobium kunmingense]PKB14756.1 VIT1/CCC1 family predicted Fe2+/Mn2+ transporter [Novosphingobium kunmingense]